MMKTICFNTGRPYTANGQRITATLHEDGVVTFRDHDRLIDGQFKLGMNCQFNQVEVMHWYDANRSESTSRSWQDAFLVSGCNHSYEVKQ